ncbi:PIN domain-containing protein [Spirulina major CS-329]|jgi:predicted nucleic acid-binding protein|uniref:type II toxin-antitoxin system VapC family toxin n=1 Tax=Spirulina TaxID=1154 RepID=UPI00232E6EE6|nr:MULTISPECIES: PIN domain-containing protein [Spirulina]MDB9493294.1 PIN domain-containing protein [Spirulina subsalsa CS-330]MDB9502043.1 PIN domain-containing protein [Spirulina major CS-329]
MRTIFVDTGYWIALISPDDDLHDQALWITEQVLPAQFVTTELVLNELLNAFSRHGARFRQAAVSLIDSLLEDETVEIIPQSIQLFHAALALYRQRPDQAWSHTDCVSFHLMRERKIMEALAYDRHFEQAGFVALLRDRSSL